MLMIECAPNQMGEMAARELEILTEEEDLKAQVSR